MINRKKKVDIKRDMKQSCTITPLFQRDSRFQFLISLLRPITLSKT